VALTAAVAAAFGSAGTFAVSTSVQHQAAEQAPESVQGVFALLGYLIRRPMWLLGQLFATLAFVLHAVALHFGPLAIVQPIVVSGIVWAVPARAALSRRLPTSQEVVAVSVTAGGLAVFLIASSPSTGHAATEGWTSLLLVAAGVLVALAANAAASVTRRVPRRRAFFLGVTAGVLFGLVAGLLKMTLQVLDSGGIGGVLTSWPTYALLAAGAGGVLTNQRAYRVAGLSASMPVLNIVNVLTALVFGYAVFGEVPRHQPLLLAIAVAALAAIGAGLWLLVRLEEGFLEHPGPAGAQDTIVLGPRENR
jgi:hypothetical protein